MEHVGVPGVAQPELLPPWVVRVRADANWFAATGGDEDLDGAAELLSRT